MPSLPKSHKELIEPYIAKNEKAIDGHSIVDESESKKIGEKTYLLTEKRFLILDKKEKSENVLVNSIFLDSLGGVKVTQIPDQGPDENSLIVGGLLALVGIISFGLLGPIDHSIIIQFLALTGVATLIIGAVMFYEAFQTPDGRVSITLQTPEGKSVMSVTFGEEALEFAEAVSKQAAEVHLSTNRPQKVTS